MSGGFKALKSYFNVFRGFKVPTKLGLMISDAKLHRERYDRRIDRSQNTEIKYSLRI